MAIIKSIGGDRLGSGKKMKTALNNYERSTHDMSYVWRSTMAPGVLVPFMKFLCPKADTWSINLAELVKTVPAIGPLFGQYKLQLDIFECPIRLYNGILHNNMTKIGMDMSKVKLPKYKMKTKVDKKDKNFSTEEEIRQISTSSLIRYMGLSGIGGVNGTTKSETEIEREINAIPVLAYYDIFKNYYANKQEENAYYIENDVETTPIEAEETLRRQYNYYGTNQGVNMRNAVAYGDFTYTNENGTSTTTYGATLIQPELVTYPENGLTINAATLLQMDEYQFRFETLYQGKYEQNSSRDLVLIERTYVEDNTIAHTLYGIAFENLDSQHNYGLIKIEEGKITYSPNLTGLTTEFGEGTYNYRGLILKEASTTENKIKLQAFDLDKIDKCRTDILKNTDLNNTVYIGRGGDIAYAPYTSVNNLDTNGYIKSKYTMQGLVVKTYQSDILNNWLSTDWVDGINGIKTITAVDVSGGSLDLDALNLKQKVYNMLNQIAISGGTYEDWQEAVWGEEALRRAESPIYCGGASGKIGFEEIISTADTNTAAAGDQPLGSLAGKGTLYDVKGGQIEIKIQEPSYIIGIASITPYLDYSQGNDFDLMELDSLDDIHKPALDEIGFQDLLLERAAWWATEYDTDNEVWLKHAGGKTPAWMEYMTNLNKVHGEFAEKTNKGWMVLTRDYENGYGTYRGSLLNENAPLKTIPIKDWTTYINPTKFNYQFADTSLTAQNFWVQIGVNATVRRKISAKVIPNL